ncbi:glucose PTS transporter subunit IIA [Atopobium fossor]|uniref:glucose PTS transporter subunit IIA n=1 Tax=Atopobium fossor TaxID=39487 RepID=UPI00041DE329|nr:glucose PTS transporter subunit IIA [Atopobium fossor]
MTAASTLEILYAPVAGKIMHLTDVADTAFAQGMLGPGAAIEPADATQTSGVISVVAPLSGTITAVAAQGHAVGIRSTYGLEILVHVGIDTVELDGKPFLVQVQVGDIVQMGDVLLHADIAAIIKSGRKPTVMVVVTSGAGICAAQDEIYLQPRRNTQQKEKFLEVNSSAFVIPTKQHATDSTSNVEPSSRAPQPTLGDRIPWPDDQSYANIPTDEALDLYLDWTTDQDIDPWDHQVEALLSIAAGNHVILGTPTGSGKSLVALGMCFIAVCTDRRAYYTAPIKALVSEKFFALCDVLGKDNVGMITGDVVINAEAPIICCTAEILAQDALRFGDKADIGCVVMDEFHYYADPERGWAWQVPLLTLPHTQFLLMSATLGDVSNIAQSLTKHTGRKVDLVLNAPRPVPLSYEFVETPLEATVELALRDGDAPLYIVHFSQEAAVKSAQALASYGVSTKDQREQLKDALKGARFNTAFGKTLKRLLLTGVGVHHAGMLPRYRLLVERLAQQGLIPVICGTDTLGVGINVPIHTVLLTQLTKFDGRHMRRLNAREFHQIAGRAGRSGFDTEGRVIAQANEYDIERARALLKAAGDPKKARKIKTKTPPKDFVSWNGQTFERLIEATPEALMPRLKITNSMVLAEVEQGGDAWTRLHALVNDSAQSDLQKAELSQRIDEVLATLLDAQVISRDTPADMPLGPANYTLETNLPDNFLLTQPLSPFMLAALELLDPEEPGYALDLISMIEATLDNPGQILRAQEKEARVKALTAMKAEGIDYDERMERVQEISYPKPLEDLLNQAFASYCEKVPWAADYALAPKSVLREMVESAYDFKTYISYYKLSRSEGTLLRYLSDAYRILAHTIPTSFINERLDDIISWLSIVVRTTDSSLIDEWSSDSSLNQGADLAAPNASDVVVVDRRGTTLLVRNALFARVRLAAFGRTDKLGELDTDWGWREAIWQHALDTYFEAHDDILLDADARSVAYLQIDESDEKTKRVWHVHQIFSDPKDDHDFGIWADVDLDATQEEATAIFTNYRVGFFEDVQHS